MFLSNLMKFKVIAGTAGQPIFLLLNRLTCSPKKKNPCTIIVAMCQPLQYVIRSQNTRVKKGTENPRSFHFITNFKSWEQFKRKNLYTNISPGIIFYNQTKVSIMEHQCNKQVQFANPSHNLANRVNNHSKGQYQRASVKFERNPAFSRTESCK